jgi:hypothetical protein
MRSGEGSFVHSFIIIMLLNNPHSQPRRSEFSYDVSFPTNFLMTKLQRKNLGSGGPAWIDYLINSSVIGVQSRAELQYFVLGDLLAESSVG